MFQLKSEFNTEKYSIGLTNWTIILIKVNYNFIIDFDQVQY